ncbi:MAG: hypothetical protein M1819_006541 [Sarea resinae]|nr:MAG: hypothetical protein M1819_006541 [Sarea resinae]
MSLEGYAHGRPLSVAIPDGPYYPRHPTLAEILANTAPPPWTLSAFMAYLSQNHCLETLEFTMDASRYRKHFNSMMASGLTSADSEACQYARMLWERLLDTYITPNGPREVNLPSNVRDRLLALRHVSMPPSPDALDQAVKIIYELMDESVLVPFLNSVQGPRSHSATWNLSAESVSGRGSFDERRSHRISRRESPPRGLELLNSPYQSSSSSHHTHHHHRMPSSGSAAFGRGTRLSPHRSNSSSGSGDVAMDDSPVSTSSREPMTPPTTPPTSDAGGSPRSRSDNTWKKMTGKLGWKKKSAGGLRDNRVPEFEDEGNLL